MYRAQRAPSKILQKKWQEQDLQIHRKKLNETKAELSQSYDASTLSRFQKQNKAKAIQMKEDQYIEIDRQNRILYERMTDIAKKGNGTVNYSNNKYPYSIYHQLILFDRWNRINVQEILKRLQEQQSNYNVTKWELDRQDVERQLDSMCEYPHMFKQSRKKLETVSSDSRNSTQNFNVTGYSSFSKPKTVSQNQMDQESLMNKTTSSQFSANLPHVIQQRRQSVSQATKKKHYDSIPETQNESLYDYDQSQPNLDQIPTQLDQSDVVNERKLCKLMQKLKPIQVSGSVSVDQNRIVLWKQYAHFGENTNEQYLIEISKTKNRFYVVAQNIYSQNFSAIELYRIQAKKILRAFGQSFQKLITQLNIKYGKLMIIDMDYILQQDPLSSMTMGSQDRPHIYKQPSIIDTNRASSYSQVAKNKTRPITTLSMNVPTEILIHNNLNNTFNLPGVMTNTNTSEQQQQPYNKQNQQRSNTRNGSNSRYSQSNSSNFYRTESRIGKFIKIKLKPDFEQHQRVPSFGGNIESLEQNASIDKDRARFNFEVELDQQQQQQQNVRSQRRDVTFSHQHVFNLQTKDLPNIQSLQS